MACFIFVHGVSHGGWCWEKIVFLLEVAGHVVSVPDLPVCGKDQTLSVDVMFAGNVATIQRLVECRPDPVILIGHSLGGVTITQVVEAMPEWIRVFVYLTVFLSVDGECGCDVMGCVC